MISAVTSTDRWGDRDFLRDVQYRTDANLAARQSIYAYQHPRIDLPARVLDLASPEAVTVIADIGCGNGAYLAELAKRGVAAQVIGADLSAGMLAAARQRLGGVNSAQTIVSDRNSGSALARPAGRVALAVADAVSLPIQDGAADLTLAMHMLYHVPDPPLALREFRRITRTGGRVVIGLNGASHLRQLRDVIDTVLGGSRRPHERVTLDDGETLARPLFTTVTRHDFVAEVRILSEAPIAAYLRSISEAHQAADPDRLVADVLAALPRTPDAHFTITTHAGCLVCEV
jgi:SAM-dependent methyltransferase